GRVAGAPPRPRRPPRRPPTAPPRLSPRPRSAPRVRPALPGPEVGSTGRDGTTGRDGRTGLRAFEVDPLGAEVGEELAVLGLLLEEGLRGREPPDEERLQPGVREGLVQRLGPLDPED